MPTPEVSSIAVNENESSRHVKRVPDRPSKHQQKTPSARHSRFQVVNFVVLDKFRARSTLRPFPGLVKIRSAVEIEREQLFKGFKGYTAWTVSTVHGLYTDLFLLQNHS